jgi:hypothetical protein
MTESQEEAAFGQIYMALTRSYHAALQAIPPAEKNFQRCLQDAISDQRPKAMHTLWQGLIRRCKTCYDVSEALQLRLTNMDIKDLDGGRNDSSFWVLCKTFLQSFVDLVTEMREARNLRLLPQELVLVLRPVQKTSREAGRLIDNSPWKGATDGVTMMPAPTPYTSASGAPPPLHQDPVYVDGLKSANGANGHASNGSNGSRDGFSSYSSALTQHHAHQANGQITTLPLPVINPIVTTAPAVQPVGGPGSAPSQLSSSSASFFPPPLHAASPLISPLSATPLSAALGPAAQATIPSAPSIPISATVPTTPATATTSEFPSRPGTSMASNDFFKGDVFQRADSLLNMQQASMNGGMNFFSVRR